MTALGKAMLSLATQRIFLQICRKVQGDAREPTGFTTGF